MDKQAMIDYTNKEISGYAQQIELINLLPDMPVETFVINRDSVCFFIPYNLATLRKIRRALGSNWRLSASFFDNRDGVRFLSYRHSLGYSLSFHLQSSHSGATCARVKVGERTVPIYDVTCQLDELPGYAETQYLAHIDL